MQTLSCTLVLLVVMTLSSQASKKNISSHHPTFDMQGLINLLESLDTDLGNFQQMTCSIGLMSHNCALSDLSKLMRKIGFLNSGYSPGKRSLGITLEGQDEGRPVASQDIMQKALALQDDIVEQRKVIKNLLRELHQIQADDFFANKKPSCRFRLGGHCLTEDLDRAASLFTSLGFPDSLGRRRRSTVDTNSGHDVRTQERVRAENESRTQRQ